MIFIFDVDGTLTPSRGQIDAPFKRWLDYWIDYQQSQGNQIWIISGSDIDKTVEQLGQDIVIKVDRCYNCMGNTLWQQNHMVYENQFDLSSALESYLENKLLTSDYPNQYGNHIEHRPGMINFSIVGRGAIGEQRTAYYHWDLQHQERANIANEINQIFSPDNITALVGGETGLDISYTGSDKSQIISCIDQPAVFFGDKMSPGGNDYPLRVALERVPQFDHVSHSVNGYMNTMRILQTKYM